MNTMQRAHELARMGVSRFGGKHSEYFSQALKIACAEARSRLTVPEKQGPCFMALIVFILFTVVFYTLAVDPVQSIKMINSDIPINFIDIKINLQNSLQFKN